jgi:hypothetical protein
MSQHSAQLLYPKKSDTARLHTTATYSRETANSRQGLLYVWSVDRLQVPWVLSSSADAIRIQPLVVGSLSARLSQQVLQTGQLQLLLSAWLRRPLNRPQ